MKIGKANGYRIIEYEQSIIQAICSNQELLKLLGESGSNYPEDTIPYRKIFPYEYIPEADTDRNRYINFAVSSVTNDKNNIYSNLTIQFFVMSHQEVIQYEENGTKSLWYDKAVCELDNIFCQKDIWDKGTGIWVRNIPYCPKPNFRGRMLTFKVKDFNGGLPYGK